MLIPIIHGYVQTVAGNQDDTRRRSMTPREFLHRWGEGIQKITPLQLTFQQLIGQVIVLIGIICGLVVTFSYKQWWLFIILVGSLFVAGTSFVGAIQKYTILKRFLQPSVQPTEKEVSYVN